MLSLLRLLVRSFTTQYKTMNKKEIEKELKVEKNKLIIDFNYKPILVDYEDGLKILAGLQNVETFKSDYKGGGEITALTLGNDNINFKLMSHRDYVDIKTANLLHISLEELRTAEDPEN